MIAATTRGNHARTRHTDRPAVDRGYVGHVRLDDFRDELDEWTPAPEWFELSVIVAGLATLAVEIAGVAFVAGWIV